MTNRLFLSWLVVAALLVLAVPGFPQDKAAADKTPNPKDEYAARAKLLDKEQVDERLTLAGWCIDQGLFAEAQYQLNRAAVVDPKSEALLPVWSRLAGILPRKQYLLSITLDDGNVVKGVASPQPYLLCHKDGVLLLPFDDLKEFALIEQRPGSLMASVKTSSGTFEGRLIAAPLEVKSSLGQFSIPFEKIRAFRILDEANQPEPAAPANTEGEVQLNWDKHLANLKANGLDIVFVFDSTGSMGGIILETKTRIRQLMKVVTYLVPDARLGLVTYRDKKEYDLDDYEYTTKAWPLTRDIKALEKFLRETEAYGGGDIPEAVMDGLDVAIRSAGWNAGSTKVIILFGDAPPRPANDGLNKTYRLVAQWHKDTKGIVSCIDTTGGSRLMEEFQRIAASGGGEATFLNNERDIIRQLVVYIFGSEWRKEIDRVYNAVLKGPEELTIIGGEPLGQ